MKNPPNKGLLLWQMSPKQGDPQHNLDRLAQTLPTQLHHRGNAPGLVVLPELATSGYLFTKVDELREAALRAELVYERLHEMAKKCGATLVVGFAETRGDLLFNSVAVVAPAGPIGCYRKIFLGGIDQPFTPGEELVVFKVGALNCGVCLCLDLWFPELTRAYLDLDVDLLLHPSAFGGAHTLRLAKVRAQENAMAIATCNRIGREVTPDIDAQFCGRSQVLDANGTVVNEAGEGTEEWLQVELPNPQLETRRLLGVDLNAQRRSWRRVQLS